MREELELALIKDGNLGEKKDRRREVRDGLVCICFGREKGREGQEAQSLKSMPRPCEGRLRT